MPCCNQVPLHMHVVGSIVLSMDRLCFTMYTLSLSNGKEYVVTPCVCVSGQGGWIRRPGSRAHVDLFVCPEMPTCQDT